MSTYPPHIEALRREAARTSVEAWAIRARLVLSRGVERVGPCPVCGGKDRFSINTKKNAWNCRGCDKGGRDAISLAMHLHSVGFVPALEMITGRSADELKTEDPAARARRKKADGGGPRYRRARSGEAGATGRRLSRGGAKSRI